VRLEASLSAIGLIVLLSLAESNRISPTMPVEMSPERPPRLCASGINLVENVRNYEFFGIRAEAASTSLRQRLLVSMDYEGRERRFTGQTDWHIEWRACFEQEATRCRIGGVTSTVNVTYTLPKWADRDAAPARLRDRWDRYIAGLTVHEKGHGTVAHDVARDIEAELVGMVSTEGCDALNSASVRVVDEVMNRGETRQREYDRATFHGSTQGAQFPF